MSQHYFSLKNLIRFTTVLITINSVIGIAPLNVFPNLSQSVQAKVIVKLLLNKQPKNFRKKTIKELSKI
jgi:hypothetical protein